MRSRCGTAAQSTYTQDMIEQLAIRRNVRDITLMAPAVHASGPLIQGAEDEDGAITISGGQSYENLFLVNGVTVNDNARGQALEVDDQVFDATNTSETSCNGSPCQTFDPFTERRVTRSARPLVKPTSSVPGPSVSRQIGRVGQQGQVEVAAKLGCAVQHARLGAHQQVVDSMCPDRRKGFVDRARDQGSLPWRDSGARVAHSPASALAAAYGTRRPIPAPRRFPRILAPGSSNGSHSHRSRADPSSVVPRQRHDLEGVFWLEDEDGKWPREVASSTVDEFVAERTSVAVKEAL